jgi:hypothetical protein
MNPIIPDLDREYNGFTPRLRKTAYCGAEYRQIEGIITNSWEYSYNQLRIIVELVLL